MHRRLVVEEIIFEPCVVGWRQLRRVYRGSFDLTGQHIRRHIVFSAAEYGIGIVRSRYVQLHIYIGKSAGARGIPQTACRFEIYFQGGFGHFIF